jgi:hypothetical protein
MTKLNKISKNKKQTKSNKISKNKKLTKLKWRAMIKKCEVAQKEQL